MLGKLIKHEIRHTFRSISTIYIAIAVLSAVLIISSMAGVAFVKAMSTMVLFFSGVIMVVMTIVSIIRNFYESLYGRQGYLSFTLPVKCKSLLASKIIVSIIWMLSSMAIMGLVYFLMYLSFTGQDGFQAFGTIKMVIEDMGIQELLPSKPLMIELLMLVVVWMFVEMLVVVGFIYFSVTLANTRRLQSHPKMYGLMVFFFTYIFTNSIAEPIKENFPLALHVTARDIYINFTSMYGGEDALFSFGIADIILKAVIAVVLLSITGWIMENKVNVK